MGLVELASEIQEAYGIVDIICDREENLFYGFGGNDSEIEFRFSGDSDEFESEPSKYVLELEKEGIMLRVYPHSSIVGILVVQMQISADYLRAFVFHLMQKGEGLYQTIADSLRRNNSELLGHDSLGHDSESSKLESEHSRLDRLKDVYQKGVKPQEYVIDECIVPECDIKEAIEYMLEF